MISPALVPKEIRLQEYSLWILTISHRGSKNILKPQSHRENHNGVRNNFTKIVHYSDLAYQKADNRNYWFTVFELFFFFFLSINHTCCTKNDRNWNSWFSICCLCDLAIRRRLERISPYHSQGTSTASHASTVQRFHHAPAICNIHIIQTWEKLQEADQIQIISWTADALTCSQRWKS